MIRIGNINHSPNTTFQYIGEISGRPVMCRQTKTKTHEYIEVFVAEEVDIKSLLKCTLPPEVRGILENHLRKVSDGPSK